MKKKTLAFIPARGGSKGIPRKNIVDVAGKPLMAWAIESAKKSKSIDRIVVSSEDDEILAVAKRYGAETIRRPNALAADNVPPEPSLTHALRELKKNKYVPDIIVYLQTTSPLRTAGDIKNALRAFLKSNATSLISVYTSPDLDKKVLRSFIINKKGFLSGTVNDRYPFMNRQALPEVFMPNGAIYIINNKEFLKTGTLFTSKTLPFMMEGEKNTDLDTYEDLEIVRKALKNN